MEFRRYKNCLFMIIIFFSKYISAQVEENPKKIDFSGYLSNMQGVITDSIQGQWNLTNFINNRLNFQFFPTNQLSVSIQARNRIIYGDYVTQDITNMYKKSIEYDNGLFKLTKNIAEGRSYVFSSSIDRLWAEYAFDNFIVTIGRQRINWSQTFVWNPNDIFNSYSFFDFDYIEKPGSDAIRLRYFNNTSAYLEFAAKLNQYKKVTSAVLYKFNKWEYDFQALAGIMDKEKLVLGTGWAGDYKGLGIRGEITYLHTQKTDSGQFIMDLSFDYILPNAFSVKMEFLYTQLNSRKNNNGLIDFFNTPLSASNLSFTETNFCTQLSYPMTPLITLNAAGIYYPKEKGYYVSPGVDVSISNTFDCSFILQSFAIHGSTNQLLNMAFFRLKWSF